MYGENTDPVELHIIEEMIGQTSSSRVLIESQRNEYICVPGEKVSVVDLPTQVHVF